jgi:hypothetical protein
MPGWRPFLWGGVWKPLSVLETVAPPQLACFQTNRPQIMMGQEENEYDRFCKPGGSPEGYAI